ncbi:helix-turn-helix transcriptional regulator [Aeromonas popoffii]|uniref:Helix-turn-helix transcriptional regulator n=1 Tax=Aeromonas popoffii TaxID=70856 RepID=A0ABS5GW19_9GAMM|nr:helix-turn-helix transcriptional regulator [Aeromonas popoffii]MBR7631328.1 helix-turn-helix transcriptional regulator [Aeromonas popoffii]
MSNAITLNDQARKRLRQLREALALSRPKFAALLDIPPTTLKNYELGYREIGGSLFLLIAHHAELQAHATWLLTGKDARTPMESVAT